MSRSLFLSAVLLTGLTLMGCKKDEAKPTPPPPPTNSLKLVTVTPAAGSRISAASTINAQVDYTLADDEQSSYGYTVFMQFKTSSGSVGSASVTVTERAGRVDLAGPLSSFWARIEHPVTCYLYLGRKTSTSGTTPIQRVELTFTE